MSNKYCLSWKEFQPNMNIVFQDLREKQALFDVTLACDDDQQISAHKLVLSACSPFFQNIFTRNPHAHPLLYMKGVNMTNLSNIIDFIYRGEVEINQEQLNEFLSVAKELKLKGLTIATEENKELNVIDPDNTFPKNIMNETEMNEGHSKTV